MRHEREVEAITDEQFMRIVQAEKVEGAPASYFRPTTIAEAADALSLLNSSYPDSLQNLRVAAYLTYEVLMSGSRLGRKEETYTQARDWYARKMENFAEFLNREGLKKRGPEARQYATESHSRYVEAARIRKPASSPK